VRLYIDEDVSAEIANQLSSDHDVMYSAHSSAKRRTDAWHLQLASVEQRVLLTHNASDFRFLHRIWTSMRAFLAVQTQHAGILTTAGQVTAAAWIPPLRDKLNAGEDLAGRLLVWQPASGSWLEDKWRPDE
jgi:Domain of unknown function (DUF5615)